MHFLQKPERDEVTHDVRSYLKFKLQLLKLLESSRLTNLPISSSASNLLRSLKEITLLSVQILKRFFWFNFKLK